MSHAGNICCVQTLVLFMTLLPSIFLSRQMIKNNKGPTVPTYNPLYLPLLLVGTCFSYLTFEFECSELRQY